MDSRPPRACGWRLANRGQLGERRSVSCMLLKKYWRSLHYRIGDSDQQLSITPAVLNHIAEHQQTSSHAPEAGGQLFARITEPCITILRATGPRPTDRRTRYGYVPDRKKEQQEINDMFQAGLLFIGDWHTHSETVPTPSRSDLHSITNIFKGSRHHLPAFLLLVAGTESFPLGLHLSFHSATAEIRLSRM